jgi:hypothetical protein
MPLKGGGSWVSAIELLFRFLPAAAVTTLFSKRIEIIRSSLAADADLQFCLRRQNRKAKEGFSEAA